MVTDGKNYDIEIKPEKIAFVSNTSCKTPIIIKNGKYKKEEKTR